MLFIGLISMLMCVPLFSYCISCTIFIRITEIILIYSAFLTWNVLDINVSSGLGIFNGLFQVTQISLGIDILIFIIGCFILIVWPAYVSVNINSTIYPPIEYCLLILFTVIGQSILISSSDLVSMFLSIELQSFSVYVLSTIYRNSESSTQAGLKYFLLGGLSSALILLGSGLIYSYTGLTQFESIFIVCEMHNDQAFNIGLILIGIGFLFKVAASPLHNWAPDVYDGCPTIVTIWLTTMPKISLFVFLLYLETNNSIFLDLANNNNIFQNLLLISSALSLIIGTVVGLNQYRIKRLLAYSTISHVGFLLLCLSMNTEESFESFIFYLIQYSITNVCTFIILLQMGYQMKYKMQDIELIDELRGQFNYNPVLVFSLSICLFSIAGIPPLIGFFAKQIALYSAMHQGYYFISIICILVSVISASYYLKIIKVIFFLDKEGTAEKADKLLNTQINNNNTQNGLIIIEKSTIIITILIIIIIFFMFKSGLLLNSCNLLALNLFNY